MEGNVAEKNTSATLTYAGAKRDYGEINTGKCERLILKLNGHERKPESPAVYS